MKRSRKQARPRMRTSRMIAARRRGSMVDIADWLRRINQISNGDEDRFQTFKGWEGPFGELSTEQKIGGS